MGKVPSLKHGDTVITEAAAICTYLADEFPDKKLNMPVGTPRRGEYLKWLFFGPSVIEPAMTDRAFPRKEDPRAASLGWRDFDTVLDIVSKAVAKGPYLMGEQFTAADVVIGSGLRYGMMFKMIPERKEFTDYVARIATRPALKRARGKGQGIGGAGGLARLSAVAQDRCDQSPDDQDHRRPEREKGEQAGPIGLGLGSLVSPSSAATMISSSGPYPGRAAQGRSRTRP